MLINPGFIPSLDCTNTILIAFCPLENNYPNLRVLVKIGAIRAKDLVVVNKNFNPPFKLL